MDLLIRNGTVVAPRGVRKADLLVRDGVIAAVGRVRAPKGASVVDAAGLHVMPAFVDIHTHGGLLFDFTGGEYDVAKGEFVPSDAAFQRGIPRVLKSFARHGVGRALLATVAAPEEVLERSMARAADYIESAANGIEGTRLEGVNLEGTFLMRPERAGAQNPQNFRKPDPAIIDRLLRAGRGNLRYVNLVPEYGKAAEDLTRYMTRRGILVGAGHSACDAEVAARCRKAGLRVCVHFLNGALGTSYKPFGGGNMVEAVLADRGWYAELICDGWHVARPYALDSIARKGFDRIVLVTDAMFLTDAGGVTEFTVGGRQGEVHSSGQFLQVKGDSQTLFGSLLHMDRAVENVLNWTTRGGEGVWTSHKPLPVAQALLGVARAAAANPAELLGLNCGALAPGKSGDIVLARLSGKPGALKFRVQATYVAGNKVA
jgi:N-acetylglucosamine-6-phosphate deacetylase